MRYKYFPGQIYFWRSEFEFPRLPRVLLAFFLHGGARPDGGVFAIPLGTENDHSSFLCSACPVSYSLRVYAFGCNLVVLSPSESQLTPAWNKTELDLKKLDGFRSCIGGIIVLACSTSIGIAPVFCTITIFSVAPFFRLLCMTRCGDLSMVISFL